MHRLHKTLRNELILPPFSKTADLLNNPNKPPAKCWRHTYTIATSNPNFAGFLNHIIGLCLQRSTALTLIPHILTRYICAK